MSQPLSTVAEIVEAIGGTKAACLLLGVGQQAVSHWRVKDRLPPHTYPTIQSELMKRGLAADLSLWRWERKRKPVAETDPLPAG